MTETMCHFKKKKRKTNNEQIIMHPNVSHDCSLKLHSVQNCIVSSESQVKVRLQLMNGEDETIAEPRETIQYQHVAVSYVNRT